MKNDIRDVEFLSRIQSTIINGEDVNPQFSPLLKQIPLKTIFPCGKEISHLNHHNAKRLIVMTFGNHVFNLVMYLLPKWGAIY